MTSGSIFAALLVGAGLAMLAVGVLLRGQMRVEELSEILDLPYGERDVPVEAITESRGALIEGMVGHAGRLIGQLDSGGNLARDLEKAHIPLRPGEYVLITGCGGIVLSTFLWAITNQWLYAPAGLVVAIFVGRALPKRLVKRRRRKFEQQLPDALTLIASSLSAGHTFLRAIQMMTEEAEAPLAEEFDRVVTETRLGTPLVDALARLASRLEIRDLDWSVQAIRIQQSVGGKLADVLHTLADFMRSREEIRREVSVLTAEGRISAYILGALPVFLLLTIQVTDANYLKPMLRGWGLGWLGIAAAGVVIGMMIIFRMVKIDI
jgi:tight adherence protein B